MPPCTGCWQPLNMQTIHIATAQPGKRYMNPARITKSLKRVVPCSHIRIDHPDLLRALAGGGACAADERFANALKLPEDSEEQALWLDRQELNIDNSDVSKRNSLYRWIQEMIRGQKALSELAKQLQDAASLRKFPNNCSRLGGWPVKHSDKGSFFNFSKSGSPLLLWSQVLRRREPYTWC